MHTIIFRTILLFNYLLILLYTICIIELFTNKNEYIIVFNNLFNKLLKSIL